MGTSELTEELELILSRVKEELVAQAEPKNATGIIELLSTNQVPKYFLKVSRDSVDLQFGGETNKIELCHCIVNPATRFPSDLQELRLEYVDSRDEKGEELELIDVTEWIPMGLRRLEIFYYKTILSLERISSVEEIFLASCTLKLDSASRLRPTELKMSSVKFTKDGEQLQHVTANDFLDLHKIQKLALYFHTGKMSLRLSEESLSIQHIDLKNVQVLNWKEANWKVGKLELWDIPFIEETEMSIEEMDIGSIYLEASVSIRRGQPNNSSVDISCLPQTIERLTLRRTEIICNGTHELPNLKFLTLSNRASSSCLSHLHSANLKQIFFSLVGDIDADLLPEAISQIKITHETDQKISGRLRNLDKLILQDFTSYDDIEKVLTHFQPKELIVLAQVADEDLVKLIKCQTEIKSIAIGRANLEDGDFHNSILSEYVDKKSDYYLFEGKRGQSMGRKEFWELREFSDVQVV